MRGTTNNQIIHRHEGVFVGVGLGSDFCAEHEWGTDEIKRRFGLPAAKQESGGWGKIIALITDMPLGIDKYVITQGEVYPFEVTKELTDYDAREMDKNGRMTYKKTKVKLYGLTSYNYKRDEAYAKKTLERLTAECYVYHRKDPDKRVYAAWDSKDFMFMVESKQEREDILKAFQEKDIAIFLGGAAVFSNGTFNILIRSRVPQCVVDEMKAGDLDHRALMKAFKALKIEERLRDAKCGYFALSPRWKDDTKKEIHFWLNPSDQQNNNSGWFTIQDLEAWIKGEGKIPKNSKVTK